MSDLRKAAEEVLERWDSPAWEWMKQGPTAELMATLRVALAAPSEDIEALRRENERLRGLLTDASKAVWMNYDGDLLNRIEAALKEVPR